MKYKTTDDLQQELERSPSLSSFLQKNEQSFQMNSGLTYIRELFDRSRLSKAALARSAGMSEIYVHQIYPAAVHLRAGGSSACATA